jgi:hypothetical protein
MAVMGLEMLVAAYGRSHCSILPFFKSLISFICSKQKIEFKKRNQKNRKREKKLDYLPL